MNVLKRCFSFLLLYSLSVVATADDRVLVESFAKRLIEIISNADESRFQSIECVKIDCRDIGARHIFDGGSENPFKRIMSSGDVTYQIFGPYTVEAEYPNATYTIVFYPPEANPLDINGNITQEVGIAELYKTFLQTQVSVVKGKVQFQRVPFYLEAHHPYEGDYG